MESIPHSDSNPTPYVQSQTKPFSKKVEPFFFNPTLKLAALRIALLASAAVLGAGSVYFSQDNFSTLAQKVNIATLGAVFLHHFISAFKFRFFIRLLDLILLLAEICLLVIFSGAFAIPNRVAAKSFIVLCVAAWSLTASLLFLFICRVAAIIRHKGRNLFKAFDLLEDAERIKSIPIANCPAAYSLLIGRSIWRIQFVGESLAVRLLRGFMAGAFITALIGYGVLSFVVNPVQETALMPVKESRGDFLPFDEWKKIDVPVWNFAFVRPVFPGMNETGLDHMDTFRRAVNVTMLLGGPDVSPSCSFLPDEASSSDGSEDPSTIWFQLIFVQCPSRDGNDFSEILPDVLIEINYESLWIGPNALSSMVLNSVGVYVSLTNDTVFTTSKLKAIPLPADVHYLAGVTLEFRKLLKRPVLSALGMFEATQTFTIPQVERVVPDPLITANPPVFNMSSNSSTFRLFASFDSSEYRIVEDSREQSVLGGFAAVGGLWTFLGGIFAMIFGTSLMKIFFDSKELSMFGIAQKLEKDSIARAYLKAYPNITNEMNLPPSKRGIMALLQEHMIDIRLFEDVIQDQDSESDRVPNEKLRAKYDIEGSGSMIATPDITETTKPSSRY